MTKMKVQALILLVGCAFFVIEVTRVTGEQEVDPFAVDSAGNDTEVDGETDGKLDDDGTGEAGTAAGEAIGNVTTASNVTGQADPVKITTAATKGKSAGATVSPQRLLSLLVLWAVGAALPVHFTV
ncbi:hypothetical protein LSAT2_029543 [Lamellibrachia satsuma]|nr:hypothetical protein LSAT2_029543 [Lamellibrachia satsuma]